MAEKNGKGVAWDLSSYFPEFNGAQMREFKLQIEQDIAALRNEAAKIGPLTSETAENWEAVILRYENAVAQLGHVYSYVGCLSAAHADVEEYAQEEGRLALLVAEFEKFDVDVLHGFKAASDEDFEAFIAREQLQPIAHQLRRTRERAAHTMSRDEEMLAADLSVDGFHTWGRLYDKVSGKLEFEMVHPDGKTERLPISQWRSLMSDVDREVGRAAFEGGNKTWEGMQDVCAAALNAIAGTRLTLYRHRGIDHYLFMALFQASVKQETLDAMYQAIHDDLELPREIFRAKARAMGRQGIWWFEREAPLPLEDTTRFTWEQGATMVANAFESAYPGLADYYRSALDKRWIESEVRPSKRPGAFCTNSEVTGEQRVYMTFNGALGDVTTLAHEVGHALHAYLMRDLRPMAQHVPMTLAETASIFAEQILAEGIFRDEGISDSQKLMMLDTSISDAAVNLLDITIRYEFERAFHEERQQGEVSVSRLRELMVETQRRVFDDALLEGGEDPLFWASKLHFYITGVSFYNFPYTFGFLLAKSLARLFREQGADFLPQYEEFLRLTGSDTAENVAQRSLGVDISQPEFWAETIQGLAQPLEQYKELLAKRA